MAALTPRRVFTYTPFTYKPYAFPGEKEELSPLESCRNLGVVSGFICEENNILLSPSHFTLLLLVSSFILVTPST